MSVHTSATLGLGTTSLTTSIAELLFLGFWRTPGDIEDLSANPLEAISSFAVTNNSEQ